MSAVAMRDFFCLANRCHPPDSDWASFAPSRHIAKRSILQKKTFPQLRLTALHLEKYYANSSYIKGT